MTKSSRVDVGDIVVEYLTDNGYHGLYNPDGECACLIDDLGTCENIYQNCIAGWLAPCTCGEHDWHITADRIDSKKPTKKERQGKKMASVRESIEIVGMGCQLLVNQQDEVVVISVETWDDCVDKRLFSRLELDPVQADRLSGFFAAMALKAQKQIQTKEERYAQYDKEDALERAELERLNELEGSEKIYNDNL
jgi:hypothetical protein